MNASNALAVAPESSLETFAAELTEAVFPVALRYGVGDLWLDLELDLWHVLAETVQKWGQASPGEFEAPRTGLLAELADAAYHTALRHGTRRTVPQSQVG